MHNNDKSSQHGEKGYDPAYKYDMIFRTIVYNLIALTESTECDLTGDETSWAYQGYSESGTNFIKRIINKPGVSKGGQTAIFLAENMIRTYWYQHQHNRNMEFEKKG